MKSVCGCVYINWASFSFDHEHHIIKIIVTIHGGVWSDDLFGTYSWVHTQACCFVYCWCISALHCVCVCLCGKTENWLMWWYFMLECMYSCWCDTMEEQANISKHVSCSNSDMASIWVDWLSCSYLCLSFPNPHFGCFVPLVQSILLPQQVRSYPS